MRTAAFCGAGMKVSIIRERGVKVTTIEREKESLIKEVDNIDDLFQKNIYEGFCELLKQLLNRTCDPNYAKTLFDLKYAEWNILHQSNCERGL